LYKQPLCHIASTWECKLTVKLHIFKNTSGIPPHIAARYVLWSAQWFSVRLCTVLEFNFWRKLPIRLSMKLFYAFILALPVFVAGYFCTGSVAPGAITGADHHGRAQESSNSNYPSVRAPASASGEEIYDRIKFKYLNSGNCHRYSFLPQSDQYEFMMKQFDKELRSFTENSQVTDRQGLEILLSALGITGDDANSLRLAFSGLPPKIAYSNTQFERSKFQARLIQIIIAHLGIEPFKSALDNRISTKFASLGIEEDCDFISKAAFLEAYAAKKALTVHLNKPNLLTVVDRSLSKSSRRFIVLDLASETVLFHSPAGFGDGDHNDQTAGLESDTCSNHAGTNDSPFGMAITENTRTSSAATGFPGLGTMLKTQSVNYPSGGFNDRGIAIHLAGVGLFSSYNTSENRDTRPGENLEKVLNGDSSPAAVNAALWTGSQDAPRLGPTNGCIGLPSDQLAAIQEAIQGGSVVYFYCTPEMKR
jgi:hypothetical protein